MYEQNLIGNYSGLLLIALGGAFGLFILNYAFWRLRGDEHKEALRYAVYTVFDFSEKTLVFVIQLIIFILLSFGLLLMVGL